MGYRSITELEQEIERIERIEAKLWKWGIRCFKAAAILIIALLITLFWN